MMQVTVKTLRHYEQKGLLLPDEVDEWTGYRYYSINQMQKLQSIRDLQRLGFSLDEIKDLYDDVSHTPSVRQLTEKMKHVGPYERFYESYTEAFRYMEEQGYKVAGQHRTCYIDGAWNQDDPEKWLSVIQIPIE